MAYTFSLCYPFNVSKILHKTKGGMTYGHFRSKQSEKDIHHTLWRQQCTSAQQRIFSVENGEYVAIMGESGSGKTTLLNILAALDKPTRGTVLLEGRDITAISEKELSTFRRNNLGFVFQDFNLLDTFNLMDNIFLPLVLSGKKYQEMNKRLKPLAAKLGISDLLTNILMKYPADRSSVQP